MPTHATSWASLEAGASYERGRPDYPADAVRFIANVLEIGRGSIVVDLAAGTGKLTRALLPSRALVVAIEPMEGMRRQLTAATPTALAVAGTAEALPLASQSVDCITVAQAFHWFRVEDALAEMRRVLRSGGGIVLVWNRRDESVPWVRRMSEILDRYEELEPRPIDPHESGS